MTVSPEQAARLFLTARGRGGENAEEDQVALAKLLSEFAQAAYNLPRPIQGPSKNITLEEFLQELTAHYEGAEIAPGIQIAYLQDKEMYYAAVHIFPNGLESRQVYAKATAKTLDTCLGKVLNTWRTRVAAELTK